MSLPKKIVANAEFTYLNPDNPEEGMLFSYEDSDKLTVGAVELSAHELELFENQPSIFLDKLQANLSVALDRNYPIDTKFSVGFEPTSFSNKFKLTIEVE